MATYVFLLLMTNHQLTAWLAQLVRCQFIVREAWIPFPAEPTLKVLK